MFITVFAMYETSFNLFVQLFNNHTSENSGIIGIILLIYLFRGNILKVKRVPHILYIIEQSVISTPFFGNGLPRYSYVSLASIILFNLEVEC